MPSQLLARIQNEYNEGQDFLRVKKLRQVNQLILLNNLQRTDQSISSTSLFSFFNRVFSSLYADVLQARFIPHEDSDYKKTEALGKAQINDYQEMEKWLLDYDWLWDACFFGEGYAETLKFNKQKKVMVPEVLNPLYMVYDPFFADPKRWRYYSNWKTLSTFELINMAKKGIFTNEFDLSRISSGLEVELWDYKNRREAARMGTNVNSSSVSSKNDIYQILEHKTFDDDGNRVRVWTDKNFGQIILKEPLSKYIDDDDPWPIVRKQIFREPHSSLAISVPDIVEDKHRAKSVLMNLVYMAAKDDANPLYLYNTEHVDDVSQLMTRQIGGHIAVDDLEKAIKPLNTKGAMSNSVNAFMSLLDSDSAQAIGTAIVQPAMQRGKKSATEAAMLQQIADLTSSLQAKVISIGEKEFWSHWYRQLVNPRNIKSSDKKIISLSSVSGVTFEQMTVDDWKTKYPPTTIILSKKEAEYKELVLRRDLMQIYPVITKSMDEKTVKRFNKFTFLPKFIADSSTIDSISPPSMDEIKARQENELLDEDKFVPVEPTDSDEDHMPIHLQGKKTASMWAHYFIHEKHRALKLKQQQEQAQQQGGQGGQPPSGVDAMGGKVQMPDKKTNPEKAAVPLATETQQTIQGKGKVMA